MSELASESVAATTHGDEGGLPPLPPAYRLLDRVRWFGYVLLGLQGVGFLIWSEILYQHFSQTADFAQYDQAWFLFAHGDLYPFTTTWGSLHPYWHNDGEIIPYVLAPLYWIFHSDLVLSFVQDLSIIGAEVVGFTWLCDMVKNQCTERDAALLGSFGALLFLVSPWLWWTISYDAHMEPMVMFFTMYMAWDLSRGKRRAFVWAIPVLLGGAPDVTYVLGIGLGGVLSGRRIRRMGAALLAVGIAYFLLLGILHGNGAATSESHGALSTALSNPLQLLGELWHLRSDIFANLAPGGLLGIAAPMFMPLVVGVSLSDTLARVGFAEPQFQNVPLYVFLPVGTVAVLAWLLRARGSSRVRTARCRRWSAFVLAGIVAGQAIGWAAVWAPQIPGHWMRISNAEAATLASVAARIPASAEVIASQGVIGRFSLRTQAYSTFAAGMNIHVEADTWFVITPSSGIETLSQAASMALIGELAGPLHATLVAHVNGVWAFRLNPSPGIRSITVPHGLSPLPAWAAEGGAGQPVLDGSPSNWHMAASGAKGYVVDGLEWQGIRPGQYAANVTLSAASAVNVEVWDDTTSSILLARKRILPTDGIQTITLPVNATVPHQATVYSGWGPFSAYFDQPPSGERLEVRVWSPGNASVNVYSADLTTPSGAALAQPSFLV